MVMISLAELSRTEPNHTDFQVLITFERKSKKNQLLLVIEKKTKKYSIRFLHRIKRMLTSEKVGKASQPPAERLIASERSDQLQLVNGFLLKWSSQTKMTITMVIDLCIHALTHTLLRSLFKMILTQLDRLQQPRKLLIHSDHLLDLSQQRNGML